MLYTPGKDMTLENPHEWVDVFPSENGHFPASHVNFQGGTPKHLGETLGSSQLWIQPNISGVLNGKNDEVVIKKRPNQLSTCIQSFPEVPLFFLQKMCFVWTFWHFPGRLDTSVAWSGAFGKIHTSSLQSQWSQSDIKRICTWGPHDVLLHNGRMVPLIHLQVMVGVAVIFKPAGFSHDRKTPTWPKCAIIWIYPPPTNSHHQDYYIFSSGPRIPIDLHFHCLLCGVDPSNNPELKESLKDIWAVTKTLVV